MSNFHETLEKHFPKAVVDVVFLGETTKQLNELNFNRRNTLTGISICQDEILTDFRTMTELIWGNIFMLGGLGGLLISGRTGLTAFNHHDPDTFSTKRFLFIIGTHIAIDSEGRLGSIKRVNQRGMSNACGSLLGCLSKFKRFNGNYKPMFDRQDIAQYFVESSLVNYQLEIIRSSHPEIAITEKALEITLKDLEEILSKHNDFRGCDIAVLSGIFIHAPNDYHDFIDVRTCYTTRNGIKKDLKLV